MRANEQKIFNGVTKEKYERLGRILHTEGLNLTGNKTEAMHDGVSIKMSYDESKQELTVNSYEPFWMAPGVVYGYYNGLVDKALKDPDPTGCATLPASDHKPQDAVAEKEHAIDESHTEASNSDVREAHPDADTKPGEDRPGAGEGEPVFIG